MSLPALSHSVRFVFAEFLETRIAAELVEIRIEAKQSWRY
jgi:hypothetical protein